MYICKLNIRSVTERSFILSVDTVHSVLVQVTVWYTCGPVYLAIYSDEYMCTNRWSSLWAAFPGWLNASVEVDMFFKWSSVALRVKHFGESSGLDNAL